MTCIAQFLKQLRSHSQLMCLADNGISHTYVELLEEAARWKARLDELGVASGDVIGLCADYSFSAVAVLLAFISRGCVVALIPQRADTDSYLADACEAALIDLHVDGSYQWRPVQYAKKHPLLQRLRVSGEGGSSSLHLTCTEHREIGETPMQRYLAGPNVGHPCPGSEELRAAFRIEVKRRQRRSDGTVSLEGQRFEIPSRYRHLSEVHLRYARWDLSRVDLMI